MDLGAPEAGLGFTGKMSSTEESQTSIYTTVKAQKRQDELGVVVHDCNLSTWQAEAGGSFQV